MNTFTIYTLELKSFNRPSYSVNGNANVYVVAMTHSLFMCPNIVSKNI